MATSSGDQRWMQVQSSARGTATSPSAVHSIPSWWRPSTPRSTSRRRHSSKPRTQLLFVCAPLGRRRKHVDSALRWSGPPAHRSRLSSLRRAHIGNCILRVDGAGYRSSHFHRPRRHPWRFLWPTTLSGRPERFHCRRLRRSPAPGRTESRHWASTPSRRCSRAHNETPIGRYLDHMDGSTVGADSPRGIGAGL